jgi:hypothetical protein
MPEVQSSQRAPDPKWRPGLQVAVVPRPGTPDGWSVEVLDADQNGSFVVAAVFSGPGAKARAEEYAAWKYARA